MLNKILDVVGKVALLIFITSISLVMITGAIALFIKVIDWGRLVL